MLEIINYCEYRKNPVGIDSLKPRFSWILEDNKAGLKQSWYQIIVAEQEDFDAVVWDSGKVESDQTININYSGKKLESLKKYCYYVLIGLSDGHEVKSKNSCFTTGLMSPDKWEAGWLGGPKMEKHSFNFRKEFQIKHSLKNAIVLFASPNYYELTLNGKNVTDSVLNNVWTDCSKTCFYATYEIKNLLNKGDNAIGVCLGNGWGALDLGVLKFGKGEHLFSMQLLLEYENGEKEWIFSNRDGWHHTADGPNVFNSIYHGEKYDMNKELVGWDLPAYDMDASKAKWEPAVEFEPVEGIMKAQNIEPCRVVKELKPKEVYALNDGSYSVDFGQNIAGWIRLKVNGKAGQTIQIKHAELEYPDHRINPISIRGVEAMDTYVLTKDGEFVFEPRFTYHGFQFAQIFGLLEAPSPEDITACFVRTDLEQIGSFECDNELLNQLYQIVCQTEEANLHGLPTDCPQRDERLGWLNDMTVRNECALYNYRLVDLYEKWLGDIRDAQGKQTGAITDTAPFVRFGQRPADPVSTSFLLIPWNLYRHYDDIKVLEDNYEAMKRWIAYLKRNSDDLIVCYSPMGDWAGPAEGTDKESIGSGAVSLITPGTLMSTGFFYYNCMLMEKIAGVLKNEEDMLYFKDLAAEIKEAFQKAFWKEKEQFYATNSQASNAFPLYLKIAEKNEAEQALNKIIEDIEKRGGHLNTGNLCSRYLIEVLLQSGKEDLAFELLTQTSYPSWGYMLQNGATTVWERWEKVEEEGPLSGMASRNHPMYGAVAVCFHKYFAGIDADEEEPGFKRIHFRPVLPSQMNRVSASVNTMRGLVTSAWEKREDGSISFSIKVPFNCEGQVQLPLHYLKGQAEVFLDSEKIWDGEKAHVGDYVEISNADARCLHLKTTSGVYNFVMKPKT